MTSSLSDLMTTSVAGNMTPRFRISKSRHAKSVLSMDPGDCTIILFSRIEQENLFWATKLCEIKEWEAPKSNKIITGMLLTGNIPMTTSGFSWASSAER